MNQLLQLLSQWIRLPFLAKAALLRFLFKKTKFTVAVNMEGYSCSSAASYVEAFIRAWARYVPWNPLALYCTGRSFDAVKRLPLRTRLYHRYIRYEQDVCLPHHCHNLFFSPFDKLSPIPPPRPSVFHFTNFQDYFFPELCSLEHLSSQRNHYRNARAFADHIIVPSAFLKKAVVTCLGIPEQKISIIPEPLHALPKKGTIPSKLNNKKIPFLYYPSDNAPSRNHRRLFLALLILIKEGWNGILLCSGERTSEGVDLVKLAKEEGIMPHFVDLGPVSREEEAWLYQQATMLIFPTLFEGHGSSILRALGEGLPIVCSGVTGLPEFAGDAAIYCNPFSRDDMAAKIKAVWENPSLREELSIKGKQRATLFSSKKIMEHYETTFLSLQKPIHSNCESYSCSPLLGEALSDLEITVTEELYRSTAHEKIRAAIPPRQQWFSPDEMTGIKDHGESFYPKNAPQLKERNADVMDLSAPHPALPSVHFFTIVYNGMPFIQHHVDTFKKLPLEWHWHIVEGAAELFADTSWSFQNGGSLPKDSSLLSNDGTKEYLDEIAHAFPQQISLYRKNKFWRGKIEMISAPLPFIPQDALLWEIDVDEIWTAAQISALAHRFAEEPTRTAAAFYCRYFVGPNAVADNLGCYANNPSSEWRRVWRYRLGDYWASHEPPSLMRKETHSLRDVMTINPFTHEETWRMGLVFDHFAYVIKTQLQFKESYYGYPGATAAFEMMSQREEKEFLVNKYYPWIKDPIWATRMPAHSSWY